MAKWSGRGIPPTRRKLHRLRRALVLERRREAKEQKSELQRREYIWSRKTRKVIFNAERFDELWCR